MAHLEKMTEDILAVFRAYEKTGTAKWDYQIAAQDLPYQVGSLTKCLMQLEHKRHCEGMADTELKEKIADELADILAETLFIAHELEIDLGEAWQKMLESDQQKISDRS